MPGSSKPVSSNLFVVAVVFLAALTACPLVLSQSIQGPTRIPDDEEIQRRNRRSAITFLRDTHNRKYILQHCRVSKNDIERLDQIFEEAIVSRGKILDASGMCRVAIEFTTVDSYRRELTLRKLKLSERRQKVENNLNEQVESILLPFQFDELRRLSSQRASIMFSIANGTPMESFQIPNQHSASLSLPINNPAAWSQLRHLTKELETEFNDGFKALRLEAWKTILDGLPKQIVDELKSPETNQFFYRYERYTSANQIKSIQNWATEDFDEHEQKLLSKITFSIFYMKQLKRKFDITDGQEMEFEPFIQRFNEAYEGTRNSTNKMKSGYARLILDGKQAALRTLREKVDRQELELQMRCAKEVRENILFPPQAEQIRLLASNKRKFLESKLGDEFGLVVVMIDGSTLSKRSKQKSLDLLIEERKKFYAQLHALRKACFERVIGSLPAESAKAFKDEYGDFYCYETENVDAWDRFRKESKNLWNK